MILHRFVYLHTLVYWDGGITQQATLKMLKTCFMGNIRATVFKAGLAGTDQNESKSRERVLISLTNINLPDTGFFRTKTF